MCRKRKFYPVLAAVVNDNPEGQRAAGILNSPRAAEPCRVCRCSGIDFAYPERGRVADIRRDEDVISFFTDLERQGVLKGSGMWKKQLRLRSCKWVYVSICVVLS